MTKLNKRLFAACSFAFLLLQEWLMTQLNKIFFAAFCFVVFFPNSLGTKSVANVALLQQKNENYTSYGTYFTGTN